MKAGCKRQITDAMIARLKAHRSKSRTGLNILADTMEIHPQYAYRLVSGSYKHKQPSPK